VSRKTDPAKKLRKADARASSAADQSAFAQTGKDWSVVKYLGFASLAVLAIAGIVYFVATSRR